MIKFKKQYKNYILRKLKVIRINKRLKLMLIAFIVIDNQLNLNRLNKL